MTHPYGPLAAALCLALVSCGPPTPTPSLRLDSGGAPSGATPMFPMGFTPAGDGGSGPDAPPPADTGTPPPTDAGIPPADTGGMMMGPRACTTTADCPLNACPPGAMGCTCAMGASTLICISTCNSTPDCPTISGMALVCETSRRVCIPMM